MTEAMKLKDELPPWMESYGRLRWNIKNRDMTDDKGP